MIRVVRVPQWIIGLVPHSCPKPCASLGEVPRAPRLGSLRFLFQPGRKRERLQCEHELLQSARFTSRQRLPACSPQAHQGMAATEEPRCFHDSADHLKDFAALFLGQHWKPARSIPIRPCK
jgi:hypothetical protein